MNKRLLIDASLKKLQVGVLEDGGWLSFRSEEVDALEGVYRLVYEVMEEAGLGMEELSGYVYSYGPGSLLGIRIVCMAIRTWLSHYEGQDVYGYNSLELGVKLAKEGELVYLSSRRGKYWGLRRGGELAEYDEEGEVKLEDIYNLRENPQLIELTELIEDVDARMFREVEYVKWSGERHRKSVDKS